MRHVLRLTLIIGLLWLAGCGGGDSQVDIPEEAEPLVRMARLDLTERLGIDEENVIVKSVEATDFSDASLGVPEPGKSYAQVITPGYIIMLEAEGETYEYHGAEDRVVYVPEELRE